MAENRNGGRLSAQQLRAVGHCLSHLMRFGGFLTQVGQLMSYREHLDGVLRQVGQLLSYRERGVREEEEE